MTYFLVMGSVALSILFTLGWIVSRLVRWIAAGFPLEAKSKIGRAGRRPAARSSTRQTRSAKPATKTRAAASQRPATQRPATPWRITRSLANWHSITPFAVVAAFLYLIARLVEHGMNFRPPHTLPDGFIALAGNLGWLAAGLIFLSLLHNLAKWRCNRAEK